DGTLHLTDRPPSRGYRLVWSDVAGGPPAAPGSRFDIEVRAAAARNGLDPLLVHAVIRAESGYDPRAISRKGAAGLMQLMPETARRYAVSDRFDPAMNLDGGVRYLRYLLGMFAGDLPLALAAYNAGENAVLRSGMRVPDYPETLAYVRRVRGFYESLRRGEPPGAIGR
ncbi:MAG TPA: lytic transglycosylase domain-containing protein, partial [Burkholderiales bacterium]|nr:lytic transglycosylase domain-containing protein [Burkholderiales bacterium]